MNSKIKFTIVILFVLCIAGISFISSASASSSVKVNGTVSINNVPTGEATIKYVYMTGGSVSTVTDGNGYYELFVDTDKLLSVEIFYGGSKLDTSSTFMYESGMTDVRADYTFNNMGVSPPPVIIPSPTPTTSPVPSVTTTPIITPAPVPDPCFNISGMIKDMKMNGIQGVKITIWNTASENGKSVNTGLPDIINNPQLTGTGISSPAGSFSFDMVPAGTYNITAEKDGKATYQIIEIFQSGTLTLNLVLQDSVEPAGNATGQNMTFTPQQNPVSSPTSQPTVTPAPHSTSDPVSSPTSDPTGKNPVNPDPKASTDSLVSYFTYIALGLVLLICGGFFVIMLLKR
ncbi:carboxypeptidase regulatory-like domain-containing protein [Methanooceanicella nereidis]|nr:carboxypeptidase regulatory-like domain-containing protein [Methanocella sp. CWC-04]